MIPVLIKKTLLAAACCLLPSIGAIAQEMEVNHLDPNKPEFREGEIIVKFKGESGVNIRRTAAGRFRSAGIDKVSKVLAGIGAEELDQLMPLTGYQPAPKKVRSYSGKEIQTTDMSKLFLVKTNKKLNVRAAIKQLEQLDEVEYAEPNYIVHALEADGEQTVDYDDPLRGELFGLDFMNMPKLWAKPVKNAKRPVIAILDTGVDIEHEDLAANIWTNPKEKDGTSGYDDDGNGFIDDIHGWDFVDHSPKVHDGNGHGTHCAGIAAAVGGNGIGVVGANPDAIIMPVTVLQSTGTGDMATIIKGIDYAAANGADIISMSLGGYSYSMAEEQALGKAYTKSIIVAAAGNDCRPIDPAKKCNFCCLWGAPMFPGAFTFVLGVEASGGDARANFSNYDNDGPFFSTFGEERLYNYELRVPGACIVSTFPKGRYKSMCGTSMATPYAAGLISRLLQTNDYENKEILYGDLIHARHDYFTWIDTDYPFYIGDVDAWTASEYNDDNRPADLNFVGLYIDDSKRDGDEYARNDGDGEIDAGETVWIYPILRAGWGQSNNIKVSIEKDELDNVDFYQILDSDVDFGKTLSAYGKAQSLNPIRLHMGEEAVDGRQIIMHMTATCDNIVKKMDAKFVVTVKSGVEIGGILDENMTLYPNVHYIVTKSLMVPKGISLTIRPGTEIQFKDNTGIYSEGKIIANGTKDAPITFTKCENSDGIVSYFTFDSSYSTTYRYLVVKDIYLLKPDEINPEVYAIGRFENCSFENMHLCSPNSLFAYGKHKYCNFSNCIIDYGAGSDAFGDLQHCNISNMTTQLECTTGALGSYGFEGNNNVILRDIAYRIAPRVLTIVSTTKPSYFGSAREDVVRRHVKDETNDVVMAKYDFKNMQIQPYPEAHGLVWKILVNGYDAQDEFEQMPPIGVGKHKVEVYFNRVVDHTAEPMLTFGVRPPYTQRPIAEDASWRIDSVAYNNGRTITKIGVSVYTAYITVSGKMAIDGLNRFYVDEAVDNEHFAVPLENQRFNVEVQASGSLSSGFVADPGLGKVRLEWDNLDEDDIDDIMGYNIYRYQVPDNSMAVAADENEGVCINDELIAKGDEGVETIEFTDYNVVPGQTYYYYYKVLRSDFTENSPSKVVAATPLSASKGDANGSLTVDVADVVTEIAYLTNQDPQPFIFEAADVNSDEVINILDVVGTINIITSQDYQSSSSVDDNLATYSVENGVLYVETPVALGGVQVMLAATADSEIQPMASLQGFEKASEWIAENRYLFLTYSMSGKTLAPGKHALLNIGDAAIDNIVLCNAKGQNVRAIADESTPVQTVEVETKMSAYPNPFVDVATLNYTISQPGTHHVRIAIFDANGRIQTIHTSTKGAGLQGYVWDATGKPSGTYVAKLSIDGKQVGVYKLIKTK